MHTPIPKEELVAGGIYRVSARSFGVAIWTGAAFRGARTKFESIFLDDEYHWDDGPPNGTATAYQRLGSLTVPAPFENTGYLALLEAADQVSYALGDLEMTIELEGKG